MSSKVPQQPGLKNVPAYVPGKPIEEVQRMYGLQDVIKLASNENPLGPSPKAVEALRQAAGRVNLYPDGQSYSLRKALAAHLRVPMEYIAIGNGADGLILQLSLGYLDETCEVLVSRSSFPIYDIYSQIMHARLVKTPLKGFGLDLEAMTDAIHPGTRLIYVCNPNNPTGTTVSAQELDRFLSHVPEHVLVVCDEAYYEFVDTPDYPDSLEYIRQGRQNMIVLRTFSKVYGIAGLRVGYGIAHPDVLAPMLAVKEPFSVNLLAQAAAEAALEDTEFVHRTVQVNREGRCYLLGEFARLGLRAIPSHTNFLLVELGPRADEVIQKLLQQGLIIRPCKAYDLPEFARITIGAPEQNSRLVNLLEGILKGG
jgi:histidinol-phosphate aminotransferase